MNTLATDLATEKTRHQVVTMLYLMLLVGMVIGALCLQFKILCTYRNV